MPKSPAPARRKVYHCPSCGAEVAFEDMDVRADTMRCRNCGKVHSLKRQIQRDKARQGLGEPPAGVRVSQAVVESGGPWSDLLEYPRRNLSMMLLCLWVAGCAGYGLARCVTHEEWLWAFLVALFLLLGGVGFAFELFGKHVLQLFAERGRYIVGFWRFRRMTEFALTSETCAFVQDHPATGHANKGQTVWEICVETKGKPGAVFGRGLPRHVQEFFCTCITRRAVGLSLDNADGGRRGVEIRHPIAFGVLSLVMIVSFAYAFSAHERVAVSDGKLVITESRWWGRKILKTEIPAKDITYVKLVMPTVSSKPHDHKLEILGEGDRVMKRLSGYGREVSGYQMGLMRAIRFRSVATFDRGRFPNLSFVLLGIFLLLPMALACGGPEPAPPAQKKNDGFAV